jgi:hypothetical protein
MPPEPCPIVAAVRADLLARSERGLAKYGTTLARTDLTPEDWVWHAYEEALDKAVYLRAAYEAMKRERADQP